MAKTTTLGSGERHDYGRILGAGNVASTRYAALSIATASYDTAYASVVNENNARVGVATRPVSGGTQNVMNSRRFIARYIAGGYIANVANTTLDTPAGDFNRRAIYKNETARRLHQTAWNAITGAVTKGGSAGAAYNFVNPIGGGNSADTGYPTDNFTLNGEFAYMVTGKVPTQADYEVRKG